MSIWTMRPSVAHPVAEHGVEVGVLERRHDERGREPFAPADLVVHVVVGVLVVHRCEPVPVVQRALARENVGNRYPGWRASRSITIAGTPSRGS